LPASIKSRVEEQAPERRFNQLRNTCFESVAWGETGNTAPKRMWTLHEPVNAGEPGETSEFLDEEKRLVDAQFMAAL
jgi:hypothetical protein